MIKDPIYQCEEWSCICGNKFFKFEDSNAHFCLNQSCAKVGKTLCDGCESDLNRLSNHYC